MSSEKKYWRSVEELDTTNPVIEQIQQNEFVDKLPTLYSGEHEFLSNQEAMEESATTRRDFLKYVGFTTAAAAVVKPTYLRKSRRVVELSSMVSWLPKNSCSPE